VSEAVRLSRRVAELRGCSRSEAEHLIEGGWVRVEGQLVEEPQRLVRDEAIAVDPKAKVEAPTPVTLVFHKEPGELASPSAANHADDDSARIRVLRRHFHRLASPMALGGAVGGLAVLTQDRSVLRRLTEDAAQVEQEWIVHVAGEVPPEVLQRLGRGLPGKVSVNSSSDTEARLRFAFKGMAPDELPGRCEAAGLRVLAGKRLRLGRVSLGQIAPGKWRYLLPNERF
jgi:23S rRNA pseudouridine2604 synthase